MPDEDQLLAELAQRYEVRYMEKLSDLVQSVNAMNEQALSRKAKPFRIVTVVKDGDKWAVVLERSPQSLMEYLGSAEG